MILMTNRFVWAGTPKDCQVSIRNHQGDRDHILEESSHQGDGKHQALYSIYQ